MATAIDLADRDVFEAVQVSVKSQSNRYTSRDCRSDRRYSVDAKARVTVQANINNWWVVR